MQTSKTKLLIYLAVWQRPYITKICFNGIIRLRNHPDYDIEVLAVISEESMIPICEQYAVKWVMYKNDPLGEKKNFGLQYAKNFEFDYMMEIGSDDLITNELLTHYLPYLKYGFIGVKDVAYINTETGECRRLQSKSTYGAGRIISRKILEQCGWKLWRDRLNKGLDNDSLLNLATKKIKYTQVPAMEVPGVIDLKSDVNIWKFNYFIGQPYEVDDIFSRLSETEIDMIESCYVTAEG